MCTRVRWVRSNDPHSIPRVTPSIPRFPGTTATRTARVLSRIRRVWDARFLFVTFHVICHGRSRSIQPSGPSRVSPAATSHHRLHWNLVPRACTATTMTTTTTRRSRLVLRNDDEERKRDSLARALSRQARGQRFDNFYDSTTLSRAGLRTRNEANHRTGHSYQVYTLGQLNLDHRSS